MSKWNTGFARGSTRVEWDTHKWKIMLLFKVQNHKGMLNCCNSKRQHSYWESNLNTVRERGRWGRSPSAAKDAELFLQHFLIQQIKEFFSATANSSTLAWIWNDKGEALMKCLPQPMINLATDFSPPVRVKKKEKRKIWMWCNWQENWKSFVLSSKSQLRAVFWCPKHAFSCFNCSSLKWC